MSDRDRPLNPRGRSAAPLIGKFMHRHDLIPEMVLVSPAVRAQQTWHLVRAALGDGPSAQTIEQLYDFGAGQSLFEVIKAYRGPERCLMLVGHNPSMEGLAIKLTGQDECGLAEKLRCKFPTGALAVIDFNMAHWATIAPQQGTLKAFIRPKDLS